MLSAIILAQVFTMASPMAPSLDMPVAQDPYAAYKKDMIPIGTKVPNFKVKDDKGKDFDLYKTFKGKTKATIINFWFAT